MAVQSDISSITYTGNNSTTTSYSVPFVFQENSHLAAIAKVTATGVESVVTLTNHTGAADPNGGTVRTAVAVPATSTLTIYRTVPATQTTTYQEGGDFPAASHERALDKLTMLGQQNARRSDRSIRVTEADGSRNDMVAVANSILGLDGNKQPKAMTASEVKTYLALSGVTLDVDAGIKTFADASERALAIPDFTGQLGTQRDTGRIYISTGTAAGNWAVINEDITLSDLAAGFFTADATGRGKFAAGFVDTTLIADATSTTTGVTNSKLRHSAALSVIGRSANTSGAPADIAAANDGEVLRRSGTGIGFGQIATAGLADSAVTAAKLQNGCVVQTVYTETTARLTINDLIPNDDTVPQITEGGQILSLNITPSSETNKILLTFVGLISNSNNYGVVSALFRTGTNNALATVACPYNSDDSYNPSRVLMYLDSPNTTSSTTYSIRVGTGTTGTQVNKWYNYADAYGSSIRTLLMAQEIKA